MTVMALSKDICERCCNENHSRFWQWAESDDYLWDVKGVVRCPFPIWSEYHGPIEREGVAVGEPAPPWCPYAAEHAVGGVRDKESNT